MTVGINALTRWLRDLPLVRGTYDPRGVAADAFHMDNMTEGSDSKIMTAEERAAIGAIPDSEAAKLEEGDKEKLDGIESGAQVNVIESLVDDTTPSLGGNLDTGTHEINGAHVSGGVAASLVENVITSGSSTTVTTTEDAFAHVKIGGAIIANSLTRYVTAWTSANQVTVDTAVNWDNGGAGYAATYKKPLILLDDEGTVRGYVRADGQTVLSGPVVIGGTFSPTGIEEEQDASSGGTTPVIDLDGGTVFTHTVAAGETTFTFSNPGAAGRASSFTLFLTNGGSQTVNWPASVDWAGGTAPVLTAAGLDILTFLTIDGGTTWHGFVASLDSK